MCFVSACAVLELKRSVFPFREVLYSENRFKKAAIPRDGLKEGHLGDARLSSPVSTGLAREPVKRGPVKRGKTVHAYTPVCHKTIKTHPRTDPQPWHAHSYLSITLLIEFMAGESTR
jgi:hypothetical protein